jgi:hypothetical protein
VRPHGLLPGDAASGVEMPAKSGRPVQVPVAMPAFGASYGSVLRTVRVRVPKRLIRCPPQRPAEPRKFGSLRGRNAPGLREQLIALHDDAVSGADFSGDVFSERAV